jgi:hypothetical protein
MWNLLKSPLWSAVMILLSFGCTRDREVATGDEPRKTVALAPPNPLIEGLIERLASPNKPQNPTGSTSATIGTPDSYSQTAQQHIEQAIAQLETRGNEAFPYLIEHRKDPRYCRSDDTAILRDFTVGETCMEIVEAQVDPSRRTGSYKGMASYSGQVIERDPEDWWTTHASKSMEAIRLEALKWTIDEERKRMANRDEEFYQRSHITRSYWEAHYISPLEQQLAEREQSSVPGK